MIETKLNKYKDMQKKILEYNELKKIISESIYGVLSEGWVRLTINGVYTFDNGNKLIPIGRDVNGNENYILTDRGENPKTDGHRKIVFTKVQFMKGAVAVKGYYGWKLMGRDGKYKFDNLGSFDVEPMMFDSDYDLVALCRNKKVNWGRLSDETLLLDTWVDYIHPFENGVSNIKVNGKGYNYINKKGKLLFPGVWFFRPNYMKKNGMTVVRLANKERTPAYIDLAGNMLPITSSKIVSEGNENFPQSGKWSNHF